MRCSSWSRLSAGHGEISTISIILFALLASSARAIKFTPAPAANIDFSNLGRVGLVGDFDGISLYQYEGQSENGVNTNGSQSILAPYPSGGFATIQSADAGIQTMCSYIMNNGSMAGVVVGGNFTSLGGVESSGVALFSPVDNSITPLMGLSGQVNALLCDDESDTVYVGGSFKGGNSTNAIAWYSGWVNLPFSGLNGPVTSITKAANGNIIFGGSFTGLGNTTLPTQKDMQVINLSAAHITAVASSATDGFSDPKNVICKSDGTDGAGNTWLVEDSSPGSWEAEFQFGFEPTKLRLWNTHLDGRGAKAFRFTAFPINGILNLTYIDPATGKNVSCSSECPLGSDENVKFQDFHFVNVVGMNRFRLDISEWYGSGAGLNGIALFQDDISAYAINDFNEPTCAGLSSASAATSTGPWAVESSHDSSSNYLTAVLSAADAQASVVFTPDIRQAGNYSVNIYTPGCSGDKTCESRGQVQITGSMSGGNTFSTTIYQTNRFPKYDQIYFGYIEASAGADRPTVTLAPVAGQSLSPLTVVAQRVGFTLISSDGGLNGLFEYDPKQVVVDTADFATSRFDQVGMEMETGSGVNALVTIDSVTYVGGNFSTGNSSNILSIGSSATNVLDGSGLNGEVSSMYANNSVLYVAGQFTDTKTGGKSGLNNIAAYDTSKNAWNALGAGVNGRVSKVVPLRLNITANQPETVISLTGNFSETLPSTDNPAVQVEGFAVWVLSKNKWLQNLNSSTMAIRGELTAFAEIPNDVPIVAGSLDSAQLSVNGIVSLGTSLNTFPVKIQPTQAQSQQPLSKRAVSNSNITGVATGLFYRDNGLNITILGGHFTTSGSGANVSNLAFINGTNNNAVSGIGSELSTDSTILALAIDGTDLYAGGSLSATVNGDSTNGLIIYNLERSSLNTQPPSLAGGSTVVHAISVRPKSNDVYVGGDFTSAGSLNCPAVCAYSQSQWNRPGTGLSGVANTMFWTSNNDLIVGGALELNGASMSVASYNVKSSAWSKVSDDENFPGPVTALTAGNNAASQLWAAGLAPNGSTFLVKQDGKTWTPAGNILGLGSNVRGLQMLSLKKNHDKTDLISSAQVLMLTGALVLPGFGNASAALYNGSSVQPYVLTSSSTGNNGGSVAGLFSEHSNFFKSSGGHLAKGLVVLISFAIALGLLFLLVVAGIINERLRRRREGYMPAPTGMERNTGISRIPPVQLFSSLSQGRGAAEKPPRI